LTRDHARGDRPAGNRTPELHHQLAAAADPISGPKLVLNTEQPTVANIKTILRHLRASPIPSTAAAPRVTLGGDPSTTAAPIPRPDKPLQRWQTGQAPTTPTPAQLREAFLWAEGRTVTKTATVSLHGNTYQVDPALVGHRVELVFDPFDLTAIEVRYHNRPMGTAALHTSVRQLHDLVPGGLPGRGPRTSTQVPDRSRRYSTT
jgi:hypothetical protein